MASYGSGNITTFSGLRDPAHPRNALARPRSGAVREKALVRDSGTRKRALRTPKYR